MKQVRLRKHRSPRLSLEEMARQEMVKAKSARDAKSMLGSWQTTGVHELATLKTKIDRIRAR